MTTYFTTCETTDGAALLVQLDEDPAGSIRFIGDDDQMIAEYRSVEFAAIDGPLALRLSSMVLGHETVAAIQQWARLDRPVRVRQMTEAETRLDIDLARWPERVADVQAAEVEAHNESIDRWLADGPECLGDSCTEAVRLTIYGHAIECPRHAYVCAGHMGDDAIPGVYASRWPEDIGRAVYASEAWDLAHTEATARAAATERFPSAADVQAEAVRSTVDRILDTSADIVVVPIADATAVGLALGAGQVALLVSQDIIEDSLREIAEQSGRPIAEVRAVHDAIINGRTPLVEPDEAEPMATPEAASAAQLDQWRIRNRVAVGEDRDRVACDEEDAYRDQADH